MELVGQDWEIERVKRPMRIENMGGRTRAFFVLLEGRPRAWYLWLLEFLSVPW